MAATANDVIKQIKDGGIEIVDVRFCDLPGLMQHFSVPAHEFSADVFEDGLGFDGSSIARVPGDSGVGHALDPGPGDGGRRPVPATPDAEYRRVRPRSGHRRVVLA